ncbi:acetylornithine transaminase [soil metagenome]
MAPPLMPTYAAPAITLVRGEGTRVWDDEGREYLDFLTGLAVCSLGHCPPAVADAIADQARTLVHTSNIFDTGIAAEVAATLDRLLGTPGWADGWEGDGPRGSVFFGNSGAEANECALKLARLFGGRGRHVVVSAMGSFHGRTLATLHATGQPAKHEAFQPLPEGFRHVAWDDIDALTAALDPSVAGVLLEPLQGEGGVNPASVAYVQAVRELCDERGILLMFDEVQTGLGRTGRWFGHQHFGVVPDVVTMAKALGNGMPIGACWARSEVAELFSPGDHGSTFGGQPLAASAARATLAGLEEIDAPGRATAQGERLAEGLADLPGVTSVRGMGLLLAAELDGRASKPVADGCLAAGLIVNAVTSTALRLAPPLTVTDDEVAAAVATIGQVLAQAPEDTP